MTIGTRVIISGGSPAVIGLTGTITTIKNNDAYITFDKETDLGWTGFWVLNFEENCNAI